MALTPDVAYPTRRHYVLKLDRDADPARDVFGGRVENLSTGKAFEFTDVASLLEGLARDLDSHRGMDND